MHGVIHIVILLYSTNGSYRADWQACRQTVSANVNSQFFTAFLYEALGTYIANYYTTHWFLKPTMFLGTHIQIPCSLWQTVLLSTSYTMSNIKTVIYR